MRVEQLDERERHVDQSLDADLLRGVNLMMEVLELSEHPRFECRQIVEVMQQPEPAVALSQPVDEPKSERMATCRSCPRTGTSCTRNPSSECPAVRP